MELAMNNHPSVPKYFGMARFIFEILVCKWLLIRVFI